MKKILFLTLALAATVMLSCRSTKRDSTATSDTDSVAQVGPTFSADSAYAYAEKQCSFGPRTMNSTAHDRCGEWIVSKFKEFGCKVETQKADLKGYDGTTLHSTNIIARFRP